MDFLRKELPYLMQLRISSLSLCLFIGSSSLNSMEIKFEFESRFEMFVVAAVLYGFDKCTFAG